MASQQLIDELKRILSESEDLYGELKKGINVEKKIFGITVEKITVKVGDEKHKKGSG